MTLKDLKEDLLEDARALAVARDLKNLFKQADDEEAFAEALREGDFERAAGHTNLTTEELHDRVTSMRELSEELANEYPEVANADPSEFADA